MDLLIRTTQRFTVIVAIFIICLVTSVVIHAAFFLGWLAPQQGVVEDTAKPVGYWTAPDPSDIYASEDSSLILYGRDLILHTARYLGPKGKVKAISNGMNCGSCHLQGGTKIFGLNFSAVASTYPKFRSRSGTVEGFEKRINDCLQRSLNGDTLAHNSMEMKAIIAYLKWIGRNVKPGHTPSGSGLVSLEWLPRSADTLQGQRLYQTHCASCHGFDGGGRKTEDGVEWMYPPLWGDASYNTGAGLYRLSKLAAFIRVNMPYGVSYSNPLLTNEEAWDVSAYVNSRPRPHRDFPHDWPDISKKPIDHPFGPYPDGYSQLQHKYGPWDIMAHQVK